MRARHLWRVSALLHYPQGREALSRGHSASRVMPFSYSAVASTLGSRARSAMQAASSYMVEATSDEPNLVHAAVSRGSQDKQSWEEWARDWRSRGPTGAEKLTVVPGWAVKKPRIGNRSLQDVDADDSMDPFDVHIFVSGFALLERNIEHASRTQRVVLRMARTLAALPALPSSDESLFEQLDEQHPRTRTRTRETQESEAPFSFEGMTRESIEAAHANLNARLHPFWSSALPLRSVRIAVRADGESGGSDEALATFNFTTDARGHFSKVFVLTWEQLCTHPPTTANAFAGASSHRPWTLRIEAELLPESLTPQTLQEDRSSVQQTLLTPVTPTSGLRVVCDLDDTVKRTDVLSGLRTVIRNVFCAPLEGTCVAGFDDLFRSMADQGVHFHFVSNSPIELYEVIAAFLHVHRFPPHASVRLKNYGQGRALFTSLVEAAGGRKKPSVLEAMDSFPDASFLLVGDSGEEDLELYTDIACSRPQQVAGIYIRDVSSSSTEVSPRSVSDKPERETPQRSWSSSTATSVEEMEIQLSEVSAAEQKLLERAAAWSERQAKARLSIPAAIPLRVFHHVEEIAPELISVAKTLSRGQPL